MYRPPRADKYGERLFFTCTGSDGVERELAPGGAARRVTFDNRWTFCRMVEGARTHEFDAQVTYRVNSERSLVVYLISRLYMVHADSEKMKDKQSTSFPCAVL